MINFLEMILMGVFATLFMDIAAMVLGRLRIIHPPVSPEVVGRWTLYLLRGKFIHKDINQTQPLSNEKTAALLSHYLIGIGLAGVYLLLEYYEPAMRDQIWIPLLFGVATVLLPWLWLYPSMGFGFLASKSPRKSSFIFTSLVNHTDFGLGFMIWILFFRRFFE